MNTRESRKAWLRMGSEVQKESQTEIYEIVDVYFSADKSKWVAILDNGDEVSQDNLKLHKAN